MSTVRANNYYDAAGGNAAQLYGVSMRYGGTSFVNRIINGDMRIDQRFAGASTTVAGYCVDRWNIAVAGSGVYTQQQVADAPAGFANSLRITNTTPATPTAGQWTFGRQIIEGFNIADLGWGTASAQAVTVSFWVKASITGTYALFAINSAEDRSYVGTFAVSAANTWEFKTVTIPGDTSGTWLTNNSNGIRFGFDLGSGSNFQGTANSWNSGWRQRTSGTVNFCQTAGATFQITGVQLEAGTVATPFERRPYGTELQLCQRYFTKTYDIDTPPGATSNGFAGAIRTTSISTTSYMSFGNWSFPVVMRAAPSIATFNPRTGVSNSFAADASNLSGVSANSIGQRGVELRVAGPQSVGTDVFISVAATASAEL